MDIERFVLNELSTNTYVVSDTGEALIVDPGSADLSPVFRYIDGAGLRVKAIVNTHCHFDHVLGNEAARLRYGAPLLAHEAEVPVLRGAPERARHFFGVEVATRDPDAFLSEEVPVPVGQAVFRVLETPGHSPGGVCLYEPAHRILLSGDTLFAGTVGRTDIPGASRERLNASLREKLWGLPDDVRLFPGHDVDSTIAEERMHNPFFHFNGPAASDPGSGLR